MAISVVVAVGDIADPLVEEIAVRTRAVQIGASREPGSEMGPLVTAGHRDRVRGYVDGGVAEGAELVVDGRAATVPDAGFFLGPCLFDRVTPSMALYRDEIFGPVLSVVRVETYDEAVRLVSENPYGNGVAIFTRDGGAARGSSTRSTPAWSASTCRSRCRWRTTRSAGGSRASSATPTSTARRRALLHAGQGGHEPLGRPRPDPTTLGAPRPRASPVADEGLRRPIA